MSSRTHQIQLNEELERKLRERAAAARTDAETFIVRALEEKLTAPPSFKELFAPLHEAFADSDISAEEMERSLEAVREAVWQSRRAKAS